MKRSSFLKSLFTLVAAPKIIGDIEFRTLEQIKMANAVNCVPQSGQLIADLNLLFPDYYKKMVEKYGNSTGNFWFEFNKTT